MRWAALLLLFVAVPLHAQVIELSAGGSTEYAAAGAGATFHLPNSTEYAGLGFAGGHIQLGFSDSRDWRGWNLTLGDKFFSSSVGLGVTERGAAITRKTKRAQLSLFAGSTGPGYSTPFFQAATAQHLGAGIFYQAAITRVLEFSSVDVFAGPQRTAVQSFDYKFRSLHLAGAGGWLQNEKYWNAAVDYQIARRFGFSAARTTFDSATVNSAGVAAQLGPLNLHASAFLSGQTNGQAVGAGARLGFLDLRADRFTSAAATSTTGSVGERIGRHWNVAEYISSSAGRYSVNFGGGYTGNAISASVSYETYFVPTIPAAPFQKALALTITFRAPHDSTVTLGGNVAPDGKLRYSAGVGSIVGSPENGYEKPARRVKGNLVIRGSVLDSAGAPVLGAAVNGGGQIVFADQAGNWQARVRGGQRRVVAIDAAEFAAPGKWNATVAPQSVLPAPESAAVPITLTVQRSVLSAH